MMLSTHVQTQQDQRINGLGFSYAAQRFTHHLPTPRHSDPVCLLAWRHPLPPTSCSLWIKCPRLLHGKRVACYGLASLLVKRIKKHLSISSGQIALRQVFAPPAPFHLPSPISRLCTQKNAAPAKYSLTQAAFFAIRYTSPRQTAKQRCFFTLARLLRSIYQSRIGRKCPY